MRALVVAVTAGIALAPALADARASAPPYGRAIVRGYERAWIVPARGRPVELAGVEALDWSPAAHLFAVTTRGRLTLRSTSGAVRLARRYPLLLGAPRWSSGRPLRLAFLAGRALRVVDGSGAHERRLGRARDVAPAWRPGRDAVAFVRPGGDVVMLSGTGRPLARWTPPRAPAGLSWTGDGRHLVVDLRYSVAVLDAHLEHEWSQMTPSLLSAVAAPAGSAFALLTVRARADGSQVTALELRDARRPRWGARVARSDVLGGPVVWSPDARFLLVERPLGRDWLLVDARTRRSRGLAFPRTLHAVFGGLVRWIR